MKTWRLMLSPKHLFLSFAKSERTQEANDTVSFDRITTSHHTQALISCNPHPDSTPHVLHRLWASCRHGQHHVESLTRRQGDYLSIWTIFFFSTAQAHSCQRAVSTKQGVVQLQHFTWKAVLSQGVLCQASWLFFIIDITFTNYYAGPVQ